MRKFFTIAYSAAAFNLAMLLLRITAGGLMIPHGYNKLKNFEQYRPKFINWMHLGQGTSLGLDIFAELFCASLIILGLFTRLATIPLIIAMSVAVIVAHNGAIFGDGEHAATYIGMFATLLLVGPGRISVDGLIKG